LTAVAKNSIPAMIQRSLGIFTYLESLPD
jgi:hypothetical protein